MSDKPVSVEPADNEMRESVVLRDYKKALFIERMDRMGAVVSHNNHRNYSVHFPPEAAARHGADSRVHVSFDEESGRAYSVIVTIGEGKPIYKWLGDHVLDWVRAMAIEGDDDIERTLLDAKVRT
jgi:hypothetical protein